MTGNRRGDAPDELWLHFDMTLLVELPPDLARCLTYQLANHVGLTVVPLSNTETNE
ncbi:hypothetical protein [Streptomyces sp. NPDC021622]|uniref:hypothetical protein n=1 Tax=Streptomyces sp. NPDC021622 TaxID=3155013 RepID=UPI0033E36829